MVKDDWPFSIFHFSLADGGFKVGSATVKFVFAPEERNPAAEQIGEQAKAMALLRSFE
jgi:hypothetical protein